MATRRPKVPRATPAAPKSPDTGDGGDVIQADFGTSRETQSSAAGKAAPGSRAPGTAAATPPGAARPAAPKPGAAAKAGTAKAGAAKPSKGGTAQAEENGGGENLDPVPAKAFSGRMLALFVVMIAITIMLAPTVKIFFEKRAEIAALQADISAKQSQQNDLKRQVSRWQDPNYVKQQARDRINMVMPGETGYWVFGSDLPAGTSSGAAGAGSAQDPAELPWVDSLWDSIRRSATD
ncbi:FtsB family cell division protein [Arthrobacter sp. U41]|uniref:FtsB family cell division protein n=1 Tax=Arthrobacter sp. U41 TaxID=1849032 RepID=UPI000859476F|nr:septum formation initiator family protein [Arthrobacter sp. U41]AOT03783.1 septation ring formation regulator EzrA [Arthrobacter sp. U41]